MEKLVAKMRYFVHLPLIFVFLNCESAAPEPDIVVPSPVPISPQKKQKSSTKSERVSFDGIRYTAIFTSSKNIALVLNDQTGARLGTFSKARKEALRRFGQTPFGIMNAGIFEPGETPTGLHIEKFKTLTPLNLNKGKGNFFTKPNGVFFINKSPRILSSKEFARGKRKVRLAVQSGPLLMRGRKIMKHFSKDNPSRKIRNGVCTKGKKVIFLISESDSKQPNMYDFANAFKKLGCKDALYLDGTISKLALSGEALGWERRFGAFFIFR